MYSEPRKRNFNVKAYFETLVVEGKVEATELPNDPIERKQVVEKALKKLGYPLDNK